MVDGSWAPRRRPSRAPVALALVVLVAVAATAGLFVAARRAVDDVERIPDVADVLDDASGDVENYLIVGSDSRAGFDPSQPDTEGIGSELDVTGSRSDTMMILRRDGDGAASLLSIPRDLYVDLPDGTQGRINGAFNAGAANLVRTVQTSSLDLPIHHYVEVDFTGFKELVDALGGIELCFLFPVRDVNSGLYVPEGGCFDFDGVQALAYARSRNFEEFRNGDWRRDGTADLGRITRQQDFVDRALRAALDEVQENPFSTGRLVEAIGAALRIDGDLDPLDAATSLRSAVDGGIARYQLPVSAETIDGNAVLLLSAGSGAVLDYLRGVGRSPPPAADG